jgi:hypothetical protein
MTFGEWARARLWPWLTTQRYAILLAIIVGASLAFRVHVSRACSLWFDEITTLEDCYAPWPVLLRGPSRENPALSFWLVRLATELFGRSDTAVRSISLVFGCVLLVAAYRLCRELEISAPRALLVVASLAVTPFFSKHATEARPYALVIALVTFGAVFALRLIRGPFALRPLIGLAVCSTAASATHYFALGYALALWGAVALGTVRAWRPRALPVRARIATAAVLAASLLVFGIIAANIVALSRWYSSHFLGGRAHHFSDHALWQTFSFVKEPSWPVEFEAAAAAFGLVLVAVRRRGIAGLTPLLLAFAPVGVAKLLSSGHFIAPRYLAPSLVFYHLGRVAVLFAAADLLAWALARIGRFRRRFDLAWLFLIAPFWLRLAEYPNGFGVGQRYYAGLQDYFQGERARDTALVVFIGYSGRRIMNMQYPVPHLETLEQFQPIAGIRRYLIAEFPSSDRRLGAKFGPLLERHFGLTLAQWKHLRRVPLAATRYQPAVPARLVMLDDDHAAQGQSDRATPAEPNVGGTTETTGQPEGDE